MEALERGWKVNDAFTVRLNEDGNSYTVIDGNHRYHAIKRLRAQAGADKTPYPIGWKVTLL
jgi:hypothetical protein